MKHEKYTAYAECEIEEICLCEIASVSAGAAPMQYLSEMVSAPKATTGTIANGLARLLSFAKSGCGYMASAV
jgi:hypothetical protein